ncbi:MAG: DUF1624 domain-containing protein [Candidatus Lokiarchaeota archaeon]|nr:DUF1624 domain-containing protein [Candidatus Lokiarchaeota archaeon]
MKRFSSIDFLRGLAMLMMIVLHTISDILDLDALLADMANLTLLELILLFVLPFLGGLAGFFLMISATGNMISMQKQLKRGRSAKDIGKRQVMGGFLLLIFAMLCEGLLGYHGYIGELFKNLDNITATDPAILTYGAYHFETIHAIAWCVIINGIIHAILTKDGKWKNTTKLIKQYAIIAIVILILTPLMWALADLIVPGYPYATDPVTGREIQYAVLGKSSIWDFVIRFFLAPLAAKWEPIFPYLAVSCIGSIIGIYLSQERKKIDLTFWKKLLKVGLIMFMIGAAGFIANLVIVVMEEGIDPALALYMNISEHRYWTVENGAPFLGWLFQFLLLNGFSLCAIIMIIRLVEFRGKGKMFAEKTVFIRRLGFIAFTIYTIQYLYNLIHFIVSSILGDPYVRQDWGPTLIILTLTLVAYYLITWAWEKIGYIGSMEWMMGTIAAYLIPGKKVTMVLKWWEKGKLDVEGAFYNAEWLNIIEKDEVNHKGLAESRLSYKLSRLGFIFFPFSFVSYIAAKKAAKNEKENEYQKKGRILGLSGIILFFVLLIVCISLKLSTLGISF